MVFFNDLAHKEHIVGTYVNDKTQEATIELIIAIDKSINSSPRIPCKKKTGIKTTAVVKVEPILESATSPAPFIIISLSEQPLSSSKIFRSVNFF